MDRLTPARVLSVILHDELWNFLGARACSDFRANRRSEAEPPVDTGLPRAGTFPARAAADGGHDGACRPWNRNRPLLTATAKPTDHDRRGPTPALNAYYSRRGPAPDADVGNSPTSPGGRRPGPCGLPRRFLGAVPRMGV